MTVSSSTSGGSSYWCSTCGKPLVVEPCWPLGDATCPHCGCWLILPSGRRADPVGPGFFGGLSLLNSEALLPDTKENHQQAEAIALELMLAWEKHKNIRAECKPGAGL